MSTTTQVTTFLDLYTDLLNRVRSQTGVTATNNQAKRYINTALFDMHLGFSEKFPWAERQAILVTQPKYETGTVAVAKGSTAIAGTSTLWATNNDFGVANMRAGGKIRISGGSEVYEIASVTNDTTAVLASAYVADSTSGLSYTYFEDEYALASDFLRPVDQQRFSEGGQSIDLISRQEFRRRFPRNFVPGTPVVATLVDKAPSGSTAPIRKIRFHPPPSTALMIPYAYITSNLVVDSTGVAQAQFEDDTDEPIVPLRGRHVIVLHALYHWYRDKKDDARSQEAKAEYTDLMLRLVGDNEIGAARPQIMPRLGPYRRRAMRPWGGGGGRYDINGRFDSLRDR